MFASKGAEASGALYRSGARWAQIIVLVRPHFRWTVVRLNLAVIGIDDHKYTKV